MAGIEGRGYRPIYEQPDAASQGGKPSGEETPLFDSNTAAEEKEEHISKKHHREDDGFCFDGHIELPQSWIEEEERRRNQLLHNNLDHEPDDSS